MNDKLTITNSKSCTQCGLLQPLSNFHKFNGALDGRSSNCKSCRSKQMKEYRNNNLDKCKSAVIKFRKNNKDYWKEYYMKSKLMNK